MVIWVLGGQSKGACREVWIVEGAYDAEVLQLTDKWLVSKLKFNLYKKSGNIDLPALAIQKLNSLKQ